MSALDFVSSLLAQSGDLVAVNKPPGWPTTGRTLSDEDCIQFQLERHLGRRVWALHQLDADTSGVCLFTLRRESVEPLKARWADPLMRKDYFALAHGAPPWEQHDLRAPIGEIAPGRLGVVPGGKPARTVLEVIDRSAGFCLVRARLFTGRTHQIRIHLASLGFPLVGEGWYGPAPCRRHPRQALHAYRLQFPPTAWLPVDTFVAPVPADLLDLARALSLAFPPGIIAAERDKPSRAEGCG